MKEQQLRHRAKVSVIIPVYNGIRYIRECMDSIVAQTLKEIEIIPVDAGSTDGTAEVLQEYAGQDSRIHILSSSQKSMGHQVNLGIAAATGEYIGFCEADDYLALAMYERLYEIADRYHLDYVKSDFDMFVDFDYEERVFFNYHILDGTRAGLYHSIFIPSDMPELIYRDVNMWNGIYNREFLLDHQIKLSETPKAAFQDMGFVLQTFALAKRSMYVQEETNRYRRDNANSSVYDPKSLLFIVWEFEAADRFFSRQKKPNRGLLAAVTQKFFVSFCDYYGKLPECSAATEEIRGAVRNFQQILRRFYERIGYCARTFTDLDQLLDMRLLLEDSPYFDIYRRQIANMRHESLQDFYGQVARFDRTVIFGAGECGMSCYILLRNNGYTGVRCFCDNNRSLWNTDRMGLKVLPVEHVLSDGCGEILFLIANVGHWKEIYRQLRLLGVKEECICRAVYLMPHTVFEVKIGGPGDGAKAI